MRVVLFIWYVFVHFIPSCSPLFLSLSFLSLPCSSFRICEKKQQRRVYFVFWVDVFCNIYEILHMPGSIQSELQWSPKPKKLKSKWMENPTESTKSTEKLSVFFPFYLHTQNKPTHIQYILLFFGIQLKIRVVRGTQTTRNAFKMNFEYIAERRWNTPRVKCTFYLC